MTKLKPALRLLVELGNDIVGHKGNLRGPANKLVLSRSGLRRHERKDRRAAGWSDRHPAFTGLEPGIVNQAESKLAEVEPQASILIANKNFHRVKTEIGILTVQTGS